MCRTGRDSSARQSGQGAWTLATVPAAAIWSRREWLRSLAIAPAAFIGGLLWRFSPQLPFYVAGAVGAVGVLVFARTVRDEAA